MTSCRGGRLTSSCRDTELIREHFTRAGGAVLGKPEQTLGLASAAQMFGSSSLISLWIWLTTSACPRRDGQNGSETASPKPGPGTVRLGSAFHSASFSRALRRGVRQLTPRDPAAPSRPTGGGLAAPRGQRAARVTRRERCTETGLPFSSPSAVRVDGASAIQTLAPHSAKRSCRSTSDYPGLQGNVF
ncbi:hypothetical protein CgunFtcFv8_006843 [Champsocephalus gunnari]|uniref:Uncharacterized protein n=1 Tax=Champsocephalus gunnari TaxID=52237 RepID=A0AAN8CFY2_CHAGU|nr:hypothetical protein CgunFtcFv8_006843 [Champsocephalus gunnari]